MLKKAIITLSLLAPLACGAQVLEKYQGFKLTRMSENGRYMAAGVSGLTIYDRETKQSQSYGSGYVLGGGNALSDNGMIVGTTNNYTEPGLFRDGTWHALPHNAGATTYARADGITPDGTRIVGTMDCRQLTRKAWPMVSPVLWTLDEQSGEYVFELLPAPDKDITTCSPQQISATYVSADGKTVLGQVTDYRGLLQYQIVYRQDSKGEWSYEISGDDKIIKKDAVWPEYPTRPTKPQAADYLTDEEKLAFNNANQAYKDSLEIVALTGKQPRMPFYEDFIKERKSEYDADMKTYVEQSETYATLLSEFEEAYKNNLTNCVFEFNSHIMSANGQHYGANFIYSGPEDPANPGKTTTYVSPMYVPLSGQGETFLFTTPSMNTYSVCDDGMVIGATPSNDERVYSREPWVIIPSSGETMEYKDWLQANYPAALEWLKENMAYDISAADAPDGVEQKGVVLYGTVRMNSDATRAIAYAVDPENGGYVSYFADLKAQPSGVESVKETTLGFYPNPATDFITFTGAVEAVEVYDMAGRRLYSGNPGKTLSVKDLGGEGIYLLRLTGAEGTATRKLILK